MAAKDSDKQIWTDPKDYGLPWVDIKPLKPLEISKSSENLEKTIVQIQPEPSAKETASVQVETPATTEQKKSVQSKQKPLKQKPKGSEAVSKSSGSWIWVVLILALIICSVIAWQLFYKDSEPIISQIEAPRLEETPKLSTTQDQLSDEVTSSEETQGGDNQEINENSSVENPNISKPADSGTTIAQKVFGNLIRIESQEERPQYFIVVGSLPSEADALKLASDFQAKSAEVFLILPYSESKNYRLAIGKYRSFRMAAEELEKIKSQYIEELWILKY
jgi:hypothetical protein